MKVLNVGGCNKHIPIPAHFDGWEHLLLDIEPNPEVDVVCDARDMSRLPEQGYDAVYCSHNLEHFYRHDLPKVLAGFRRVLTDDGFVHAVVPNMQGLFEKMVRDGLDIEDEMYVSDAGPIRAVDMIYGMAAFIEHSGNDFMCHKNGFSPKSLGQVLLQSGFPHVFVGNGDFNIVAFAFKNKPSDQQMQALNLKHHPSEIQHEQA